MRTKLLLAVTAVVLAFPGVANAASGPHKTDAQAERYLETSLTSWAGIDLAAADSSAFCVNGYYSNHEQRTGRHYGRERLDRNGELRFRTFSCTLSVDAGAEYRTFELYVQTRAGRPWHVSADR